MSGVAIFDGSLIGRRKIYTSITDINRDNIIEIINSVMSVHTLNMNQEDYLYWYRRGLQPILSRTKKIRPEINNRVVENHAAEIVAFKNGYFLTQPAFYVSRKESARVTNKVNRLNEYLYLSGKQQADNKVVDWFHTVGVGALYVYPIPNNDIRPVGAVALDPRSAFVVYSRTPNQEPAIGVSMVVDGETVTIDAYTRERYFKMFGSTSGEIVSGTPVVATATRVIEERPNEIGEIPIIEYQYENNRMGAFEPVVPILNTINNIQSNRADGIEQFIQSLMIFYNCTLGEDEKGNPNSVQKVREAGAIFLKSIGANPADVKILSEQLDQTQSQVFIDDLYEKMLTICGMPSTTKGGSSTSDTGAAVFLRDGWEQADTYARNTEDLFRESNAYFDRVFTKYLKMKTGLDISLSDFKLQFVRNESANILVKTQAALNLKSLGFSPELSFAKSGVSNDPISDVKKSEKYIEKMWGQEERMEVIDETRADV